MQNRKYCRRWRRESALCGIWAARIRPASAGHRRQTHPARFRLLLFLVVALLCLTGIDLLLRPRIARALREQGGAAASQILSQTTLQVLEELEVTYEDLVEITRNDTGEIRSIETNSLELNRIKSLLEQRVIAALNDRGVCEWEIPLGSLLGSEYLSGRGPMIPLRIQPAGSMTTEFESRFQAAGINQTSHRIVLNLALSLTTFVPLHGAAVTVHTNFIVADTIIVGEVPDYYTNITGGDIGSSGLYAHLPDTLDIGGGIGTQSQAGTDVQILGRCV